MSKFIYWIAPNKPSSKTQAYILQGRKMCFQLLSSGHDMIVAVTNS